MTSGNGAEQSGEEPALGPIDGSLEGSSEDSVDGQDTTVDPAPTASADRPRKYRRKAGVEYRPV
ncbi:hypothetical protein ACIBJF_33305 [Streptomyces sp. NPDC050743]|uniref:hypothetical protein n=1 Tax=Streptomyces sp. NPDC050743 TaxID=3365634 RepID=UPI0037B66A3F